MGDAAEHSVYGGSAASRYMNCPGSIAALAVVPRTSSGFADEGTAAHAVAELCLREGERDAKAYLGHWFPLEPGGKTKRYEVTREMAAAVNVYLDAVYEELDAAKDAELYVEQKFVLDIRTAAPGEVYGSVDAMVYTPSRFRLVSFDYKHGYLDVEVTDNKQQKFYCSGAVLSHPEWAVSDVELVIVQPNAKSVKEQGGEAVRRWGMNALELIEFPGELERAIEACKQPAAPCSAGPWCKASFCEARPTCATYHEHVTGDALADYKDISIVTPSALPDPSTLDVDKLVKIAAGAAALSSFATECANYLQSLAQNGTKIPGMKLVDKVGRRKIVAPAEDIVGHMALNYGLDPDELMPRELVTITEIERQLKSAVAAKQYKDAKEDFSLRFTLKESSGTTLVPESDKREAVDAVARDFGSVNIDPIN